jgi:hypothetical protein
METMRAKGRASLAYSGWEKCVSSVHPAAAHTVKIDVKRRAGVRRGKFTATGLIVSRKNITTKRTGEPMCFLGVELPDHSCIEVVVFPESFSNWSRKLKIGHVVRLALKSDSKSVMLDDDGVLASFGPIT